MKTAIKTVKFGDAPVGTEVRLEAIIGKKIDPIECEASHEFYANQGSGFWGWNLQYSYWDGDKMNDAGLLSLSPDTEVELLSDAMARVKAQRKADECGIK